ncbi:unnamed protein product [Phaedon cochleariae]|uniref:Enoyl reductase (ER) domain-containing protein n=1 Tax=Phaedon cochleariae TaxID=80249 RepID=A0A9P0DG49_PHACE|nr:unnamed protein product [Phaedon cochleariae]
MESRNSKAVVVKKFGGYESLSIQEFDLPPLDDTIEIKVEYGGLNFADLYTRQGLMANKKLPFVLGIECTGIITSIGSNVSNTDFKVGQRVICYDYNGGMYREVVRLSPTKCFLLPDFISTKLGAAIFVNYLTAYFSLLSLGNLKENETILILSCTGGVGSAATQIAKTIKGVTVFGTGSISKKQDALKNGVDTFIPNESFEELQMQKFDLILTNEAGNTFNFLQELLNPLGNIVIIGANNYIQNDQKISMLSLLKSWWTMKNVSIESLITNSRVVAGLHLGMLVERDRNKVQKTLEHIFKLIKDEILKPLIHSTMPMAQIVSATRLLAERKNVGKVLIKISDQ